MEKKFNEEARVGVMFSSFDKMLGFQNLVLGKNFGVLGKILIVLGFEISV